MTTVNDNSLETGAGGPTMDTMEKSRLEPDLEIIATLRDPTRRRLFEYVQRQPRAVSRDEAAEVAQVSRALAAFHLEKLVSVGLLKAEYRRLSGRSGPGAGRTSKLYRRSRHGFAVSVPQRNHELLARLLAESLSSGARTSPGLGPAREYGRSLGRRARGRVRGRPGRERLLGCVEDVLGSLGFDPYRTSSNEVRLRNCPFDPLSRLFTPLVCGVGQAIMSGVVEGVTEGVAAEGPRVDREEQPDRCCGVISSAGIEGHV
jgi:predicted ArsR family transcriptional regulator